MLSADMSEKSTPGLNRNSVPSTLRKSPVRYTRASVLKMLAVMEQGQRQSFVDDPNGTDESANGHAADFYSSGRTGRRNALPDILSEHAHVTSSDLPARLQALSTKDHQKGASTSQTSNDENKNESGSNK